MASCELLSDCIFEMLKTARIYFLRLQELLWIAFRLYLWNVENSKYFAKSSRASVVNCFQIVSLKCWKQHITDLFAYFDRCELLSDCIFEMLKTAMIAVKHICNQLWIAFRLYLWNVENSSKRFICKPFGVVNCFQIVSLKCWKQRFRLPSATSPCCELLSDCIFEMLKTAHHMILIMIWQLWIAFRLYLWNVENSPDRGG